MTATFTCHLVQPAPPAHDAVDAQRARLADAVRDAPADTDLVVFPELAVTGYHVFDRLPDVAEPVPGPTTEVLGAAASDGNVHVLVGLPVTRDDGVANAAVWLDQSGRVAAVHEKCHLWGDERDVFTPGDRYTTVDTPFGRLGLQICYEGNFPEASLAFAMAEVDVLVNVSAWSERMEPDWHTLLPTRALENGAYVLGCNLAGPERDTTFCGHSKVVAPDGQVAAELGGDPDTLTHTLDRDALDAEHARNPMRADRPTDPIDALVARSRGGRNSYPDGGDTPDTP